MPHFSQTSTWIANAKAVRKHHEDAKNEYFMKFIRGDAVPTQHDVDEYTKVLNAMIAAAKQLNEDRVEIDNTVEVFGGPSDTVISGARTLLNTLKSKVHH